MSIYSSREPFNDDPEPLHLPNSDMRWSAEDLRGMGVWNYEFDPRPEYNRPQNNPTNPILVARRNNPGENIYYRDLERWPTESEKEHAWKVLTRLAAFEKGES